MFTTALLISGNNPKLHQVMMDTWLSLLLTTNRNGRTDTCYHMDELWKHDIKWAKLITKEHIAWFHLYKTPRTGMSTETNIRWGLPGSERDGRPQVVAKGCRVSFSKWWKCSKIDCSHWLHLSSLRDTELHMLSGWILWYVNYFSIALKKNPMAGSR